MAKSTTSGKPAKPSVKPKKEVKVDETEQPVSEVVEVEINSNTFNLPVMPSPIPNTEIEECPQIPAPADFLTSKGFSQVHEGQKIPATFEQIHELLKEYRAL